MTPYKMRTDSDCGPAALSAVLEIPYETILNRWPGGWRGSDAGRLGVPNDTPFDHFDLLEKLKESWRIVTCREICTGEAALCKTIVLLHDKESPTMKQHWCIFVGSGFNRVSVDIGNGKVSSFSFSEFSALYSHGWPSCAYEVRTASATRTRQPWYGRLVAKLTGKII